MATKRSSKKTLTTSEFITETHPSTVQVKTTKTLQPKSTSTALHYLGHRQRLKQKFLNHPDGLLDYELLELLLFFSIPRRDVKPLAKMLIDHFGSYERVLKADRVDLELLKIPQPVIILLKAVHTTIGYVNKAKILNRDTLKNTEDIFTYCQHLLAHETIEKFYILYLDRKYKLIKDEVAQSGTIDFAPVFPREIIKRALQLGASFLILAHNHPSDDPTPSKQDLELTYKMIEICKPVNIHIIDHLIVTRSKVVSLLNQLKV